MYTVGCIKLRKECKNITGKRTDTARGNANRSTMSNHMVLSNGATFMYS